MRMIEPLHVLSFPELKTGVAKMNLPLWQQMPAEFVGNPAGVGPAILKIVDAQKPPLRVFFGKMPTALVPPLYADRLKAWKDWEPVSLEAQGQTVA